MTDWIELDPANSTTRRVIKADPQEIAGLMKQPSKPKDKFETVPFLPGNEGRQGEGGLRTQGYFKAGGIIPSPLTDDTSYEAWPLITVVTVVYNGEKFLEETILSVINQTYDNVEYIIVDGGSTDGTLDIIKKYEHIIDYWVSEKDEGIYYAMNKALTISKGDWINFLNSGDVYYEKATLKKVAAKLDPKFTFIYGSQLIAYPDYSRKTLLSGYIKDLWRGSRFVHQAVFTQGNYHRSNAFSYVLKYAADFEFFYRASRQGENFSRIDEVICVYSSGGVSDKNRVAAILEWWSVIDKNLVRAIYYLYRIGRELCLLKMRSIAWRLK